MSGSLAILPFIFIYYFSFKKIFVIIQFLRLKPPCLMDTCFEAIRLTSCKYPSDRALVIIFLMGWTITFFFTFALEQIWLNVELFSCLNFRNKNNPRLWLFFLKTSLIFYAGPTHVTFLWLLHTRSGQFTFSSLDGTCWHTLCRATLVAEKLVSLRQFPPLNVTPDRACSNRPQNAHPRQPDLN